MTVPAGPSDHGTLSDLLAARRNEWTGRGLFRVSAGRGWVRLHLEGEDRPGILLTALPGAALVIPLAAPLPDPVHQALAPTRRHPLAALLADCRLLDLGMLPDDRVAAFRLIRPDGAESFLLHQLFGPRGNTALIDVESRLLWAWQRPPHSLLCAPPPDETWRTGAVGDGAVEPAAELLDQLVRRLSEDLLVATRSALGQRVRSAEKLVANLTADLSRAEKGDDYRVRAEALAAALHTLRPGLDRAEVPDPRTGEMLAIELDPALSPAANMERWFRRARKADKGLTVIGQRKTEADGRLAGLQDALTRLAAVAAGEPAALDLLADLRTWRQKNAEFLPGAATPGRRGQPADQPARPFRRYLLDDRWEVWVGRSNTENDELTFGAAHNRDLWLHAQGVPGSHVILRTAGKPEQVPRAVIEKAAALAALHCRAKHSTLVPVIFTERRYVRKPRKSPAGTAVCLREKSLFVTPGVPPGAVGV